MTSIDPAITAIEALRARGRIPTVDWMRNQFGRQKSNETYSSLKYGRAVLETDDQLDQYLYSYAPMIQSQWSDAFDALRPDVIDVGARLIDYGCGQGLAGLLLHQRLGEALFAKLRTVVLIEPSGPALRRAQAVYAALSSGSEVIAVEKRFDDLSNSDYGEQGDGGTLHVFSNVLDIAGYNRLKLLGNALAKGSHTILAVGHDRSSHDPNSRGIELLQKAVSDPKMAHRIAISESQMKNFKCKNRGEPAISWLCQLSVTDG